LFLGTGVYLKNISLVTTIFAVVNFIALIVTAKIEENEMFVKFSEEYRIYMQGTRMFIPLMF